MSNKILIKTYIYTDKTKEQIKDEIMKQYETEPDYFIIMNMINYREFYGEKDRTIIE